MTVLQDNRVRLLEAAERLFAMQGYAGTSVREILRAADVSGPTLYHYFGSKEELLLTLLRERVGAFFSRVHAELERCQTAREAFRAYASIALADIEDTRTSVRLVFSVLFGPPASLPEGVIEDLHARHGGTLAAAVLGLTRDRAARAGWARKVAFVCALFNGMLNGILMQYLSGSLRRVDSSLADAIAARAAEMLDDDLPVPDFEVGPTPGVGLQPATGPEAGEPLMMPEEKRP